MEFLRLRRVPLAEQDAAATLRGLPDLTAEVRALAEADRDVMEKGTRAFVSWVSPRLDAMCTPQGVRLPHDRRGKRYLRHISAFHHGER